jgi:phage baseplate assembly protein gpV
MIEELIAAIDSSIEDIRKKYYGVVTGKVMNVDDPMMLGRVQVQLPFIDSLDLQPWARIATPMAGMLCGHYMLPDKDDEVLVVFEHGDLRAPYIIGALWSIQALPPLQSPESQIRAIRTLGGNQLVIQERPPTLTLQNGPTPSSALPAPASPTAAYNTIELGAAGVTIDSALTVKIQVGETTSISVSSTGVKITAGNTSLNVTSAGVEMSGPMASIKADGALTVAGNPVLIN